MSETLVIEKNFQALSPYAQFVITNLGYDFYKKKTQERLYKWEIWAIFESKQAVLGSIYAGKHFRYERKKRKNDE
jgi:hypothetical protein